MDEFNFDKKIVKAHSLSQPNLWSFSLRYGLGMGWHCIIQESHMTEVHIGIGKSWPEAMDRAILSLEKAKEDSNG